MIERAKIKFPNHTLPIANYTCSLNCYDVAWHAVMPRLDQPQSIRRHTGGG
jgi:hypothetical protein